MKYIFVILIIITAGCSHFKSKEDPFENINWDHLMGLELPNENVPQWVRFSYLGTINHPPTVIFISPTIFEEFHDGTYEFSFLSEREYYSFVKFIHRDSCLKTASEAQIGKSYLEITEHNRGMPNNVCYIPDEIARKFFKELHDFPEIDWSIHSYSAFITLSGEFSF